MAKGKTSEELYSPEELRKQFTEATRRAADADRVEPRAVRAYYDKKLARIVVELTTGVVVSIPPGVVQGLANASPHDLRTVTVSPQGTALHWSTLDADFSVSGLIAGVFGTRAWMAEVGRKGGRVTSAAKAVAARANGRKGGRPPKTTKEVGVYDPVRNRGVRRGARKKAQTPRRGLLAPGA
jgi:hypothetical protein